MLKGGIKSIETNVLSPFQYAVETDLPQWFPYRHSGSKRPIFDLNMENVTRVGEGIFQEKDGLNLKPFDQVDVFDDDDHYVITTAVGAIQEHQHQILRQHALGNQWHKMYMVKPLALGGKKNSMFQLYIEINKNSEDTRCPVPAEGSNYRDEIEGHEDKPGREWQGIVVQHTQKELERNGCHFDFVLYAEKPRGGKLARKVHANFADMASNLAGGYLSVRLHVTSTDVVATRPLSALKQLRQGSGPLRNAIIGRE